MSWGLNERQARQIERYLSDASLIDETVEIGRWQSRVIEFLKRVWGMVTVAEFMSLDELNKWDALAKQTGYLEGILASGEDSHRTSSVDSDSAAQNTNGEQGPVKPDGRDVFVVHGHDHEVKETVARFIQQLGLVPIILHEQANEGRTIIEKFEVSSGGVVFAVVLLTPDDRGGPGDESELKYRARQNVILELGYFMGRLRRSRVCAIYRGDVELPTDFQGVIYIPFDTEGGWRTKLAQEFVSAKLPVKVEALLNK